MSSRVVEHAMQHVSMRAIRNAQLKRLSGYWPKVYKVAWSDIDTMVTEIIFCSFERYCVEGIWYRRFHLKECMFAAEEFHRFPWENTYEELVTQMHLHTSIGHPTIEHDDKDPCQLTEEDRLKEEFPWL